MDRVKGKVAVVTGAATGLGRVQALLLASEGAKVVIADINETDGEKVVEEIARENEDAIQETGDSEHGQPDALFRASRRACGGFHAEKIPFSEVNDGRTGSDISTV